METGKPFASLLYYWFTEVENPIDLADGHRSKGLDLGLRGRILIAPEGVNGTVSGTVSACHDYMDWVRSDPRFAAIEFKIDAVDEHVFPALHVRVRREMITLGQPIPGRVEALAGEHLSPEQWREKMRDPNVVLLDGRNQYESEVGRFEGALCPNVRSFRDIPGWIEAHRDELDGKEILTYCTGGIRCEKLTAWMKSAGFENVYQLHGGIVMYGQDPATDGEGFEGLNMVFDERMAVPVGTRSRVNTACCRCGESSVRFVNCANVDCNARIVMCEDCEEAHARSCSDKCAVAPRQRGKNAKFCSQLQGV